MDEEFIFGWEDGDFSFRMTIAGFPVWIVPQAKVFHQKGKRDFRWVKYQVRNRWWFILKNYNFRTIIVTLPAILLYQFAIMFFLILKGQFVQFLKGTGAAVWGLPSILRKRKKVMKLKVLKDKQVLYGKGIDIVGDAEMNRFSQFSAALLNGLFSFYWIFAKRLVK
jgi:GT2 family glycosyltransferase